MMFDDKTAAPMASFNEEIVGMELGECSQFDIQEAEAVTQQFVETYKDFAVNVDLTKIQYNLGKLYEEAQKLGFDSDELEEYGICSNETKGSCKSNTTDVLMQIDQMYEKADKMTLDLTNKMVGHLKKA